MIDTEKIKKKIEELAPWYHTIFLTNNITISGNRLQGDYFWRDLRSFFPDNLEGLKIFDAGCNSGYLCIKFGLESNLNIVGVERSEHYIKQSKFLLDYFEENKDKNIRKKVKIIHNNAETILSKKLLYSKYDYIIATSFLFFQNNQKDFARLFSNNTDQIIIRWRDGPSKYNGEIFNEEAFKLGFYIAKEKKMANKMLTLYKRGK